MPWTGTDHLNGEEYVDLSTGDPDRIGSEVNGDIVCSLDREN